VDIAGATRATYLVAASDAQHCLAAVVTASNAAGSTSSQTGIGRHQCVTKPSVRGVE
jgi:hypothetical protein